jgi:hypothetical protein
VDGCSAARKADAGEAADDSSSSHAAAAAAGAAVNKNPGRQRREEGE